jgi:protein ImuA
MLSEPRPPAPTDARLAALRAEIAALAECARGGERPSLPFEVDAIDRRLAGGGLAADALHEAAGAAPGMADEAAATLFMASIAARRAGESGTILWALSAATCSRRPGAGGPPAGAAHLRRMPA